MNERPAETTIEGGLSGAQPTHESSAPPIEVRVAGLAEALHDARSMLVSLGVASKYYAANQRLIVLRNALIASTVCLLVLLVAVVCWHEAYRQTLTIAAFDVPKNLTERGITGQVVSKALFDELIKRRELVTTLDSGDLKGAWAENRADVAIPQTGFSVQALFRYLRYATGNEITIDGEIMLDGEDATFKVRVAGKPPTVVKGKISQWESLMGDLAGGVLEVTQPAVQAAYLGLEAQTPDELKALSKHLQKMETANPKLSGAVMSVAYDSYGIALERLGRSEDALLAFDEAMALDPSNGVAVVDAAAVNFALRNFDKSAVLHQRAQTMKLPDGVKTSAMRNRVAGATNAGDCDGAAVALRDAHASPLYDKRLFVGIEAIYLAQCEFEEAHAVDLVAKYYRLHPAASGYANPLLVLQSILRPEGRYREEGFKVAREAIAAGVDNPYVYGNFSSELVRAGRFDEAFEIRKRLDHLTPDPVRLERARSAFSALVHYNRREYAQADEIYKRLYASVKLREVRAYSSVALVKLGLGQYDAAIALYQEGLSRFPRSCQLWQELGKVHATRGRPDDIATALATFDKGIAAVPKCGLTYNEAARLLIKQGRPAEAQKKLEALIKIAPKSDGAVIAKETLASIGVK